MRLIPSAECISKNVDLSLLHCYSFLPGYIIVFGFSVLLGAKTFSFTFWYQLGSEPELSEFEVKVQTYILADLPTLRPTVSFTCVFFMSRRVLHISYTEHILFFFFFFTIQISQNCLRAGMVVPHSDHDLRPNEAPCSVWNLLVNQDSIQLIWFAPDCDCCFLMSRNKPNKGRNCSGVQSNCPKKPTCMTEGKLKHTKKKSCRKKDITPFKSDYVFQNSQTVWSPDDHDWNKYFRWYLDWYAALKASSPSSHQLPVLFYFSCFGDMRSCLEMPSSW